ncbi:MAG: hypothetical protein HOP29_18030 [Phycisphaerales bacterium]|nr:hypothetical protein [Phycisphaerales bacterium]
MQIRYHCPHDGCVAIIEYAPLEDAGDSITCPRCRHTQPLKLTESIRCGHSVDRCTVCGGTELFIRKDFPQRVGLAVVVVAGLASVYFLRTNFMLAYAILAAAVLVDLAFYLVIGKVTTCYACRAEYRGGRLNPAHEGFDLATSEKY